jgi:hypothetical protein
MEMQQTMEILSEMRADQKTMQAKWTPIGTPTEKETRNKSRSRAPDRGSEVNQEEMKA